MMQTPMLGMTRNTKNIIKNAVLHQFPYCNATK
jgi:hypothetical protein